MKLSLKPQTSFGDQPSIRQAVSLLADLSGQAMIVGHGDAAATGRDRLEQIVAENRRVPHQSGSLPRLIIALRDWETMGAIFNEEFMFAFCDSCNLINSG